MDDDEVIDMLKAFQEVIRMVIEDDPETDNEKALAFWKYANE